MSNGLTWFRLKHTWLYDPEIQALAPRDQLRWVQLLTLYSEHHGPDGWVLRHGVGDLPVWWRRGLGEREVMRLLPRLPGVTVRDGPTGPPSLCLVFDNFARHQYSSADRTRRWRSRTAQASRLNGDAPTAPVRDGADQSRSDQKPPYPLSPSPATPQDDCGHAPHEITKLSCSDRHFKAHLAYIRAHANDLPTAQPSDTTP